MSNKIRFWHCGARGDVLITLQVGQTLRHHIGWETDEGWSSESNIWHYDGRVVTSQWCNDGRDCDGRLTRTGESWFRAHDNRAGYHDECNGIRFPKWECGESEQYDEYAQAANY